MQSVKCRRLADMYKAHRQLEGAGFEVSRPFPSQSVKDEFTDPFLLLDEFGPKDLPKGAPGAPWHPHRGFDTVTYIKIGDSAHQDSMGNSGRIRSGEVQWMRAGSGILHDEGRDHPGGPSHGFQLWVNLPKELKMSPPSYSLLSADSLQWKTFSSICQVKIIAGDLNTETKITRSPLELAIPILYADVAIVCESIAQQQRDDGVSGIVHLPVRADLDTCFLYVYEGEGRVYDGDEDSVGVVTTRGDTVFYRSDPTDLSDDTGARSIAIRVKGTHPTLGIKFMLAAGKKIKEPVARYGPFVMNTDEEIKTAFADYRNGTLANIKGENKVY